MAQESRCKAVPSFAVSGRALNLKPYKTLNSNDVLPEDFRKAQRGLVGSVPGPRAQRQSSSQPSRLVAFRDCLGFRV